MSEEILVNVTPRETRVAVVENGMLQELHIERGSQRGVVGNIYKGKVQRVMPGMQAAFVDIGLERAAFLHDIGKALTHEVEGSHALLSAQYARRYGESPAVVHAIEAHHYEVQPQTVEAVLLIAADAISASRPGARGESLEGYIKRLESLEELGGTAVERALGQEEPAGPRLPADEDVLRDREVREERVRLEHHAQPPAVGGNVQLAG